MKKNKLSFIASTQYLGKLIFLLFLASCSSTNTVPTGPSQNGPYISSISPTEADIGSIITIHGSNFSAVKDDNAVKFGNIEASIKSAEERKLTVTVPEGLSQNIKYKITETVNGQTATAPTAFSLTKSNDSENPPAASAEVPQDGILETVTWNLDWFGSTSHGPEDEPLQVANVVTVLDSMKADLYAFEEVYNQQELNKITSRLKGYHGFTSRFNTYDGDDTHTASSQQTAFLFNTNAIDSVSSGLFKENEGQMSADWAHGRYPLYFQFNYKYKGTRIPFLAIVIHAKANYGSYSKKRTAYGQRKRAANELYTYLQSTGFKNRYPTIKNIIIMGDFNDDTDVSIFDDTSPSPYKPFVDDTDNFKIITAPLTAKHESSYVAGSYTDLIDQIIISNTMVPFYQTSSISIYAQAQSFISDYVSTTSDHLPVWAKYDVRK